MKTTLVIDMNQIVFVEVDDLDLLTIDTHVNIGGNIWRNGFLCEELWIIMCSMESAITWETHMGNDSRSCHRYSSNFGR